MPISFWWWRAESGFGLLHTQILASVRAIKWNNRWTFFEYNSWGKRLLVPLLKPSFWWIMCSWRVLCILSWTVAHVPHLPIDVSNSFLDNKNKAEKGTLALEHQEIWTILCQESANIGGLKPTLIECDHPCASRPSERLASKMHNLLQSHLKSRYSLVQAPVFDKN